MSTPPSGGSRRRRIAGERRGRAVSSEPRVVPPVLPPSTEPTRTAPSRPDPVAAPTPPVRLDKDVPSPVLEDEHDALLEADELEDHDEHDEQERVRRTGWWGSRASVLVLAGVLVLLLALTGLAALGLLGTDGVSDLDEADTVEQTERTAPSAAEAAAAAILAYDFRKLDADQDTAARFMTEDFAAEYTDTFEKVVRPAAERNRARVAASVLGSAVIRATPDAARVLVFVDQTTVSRANPRPQLALNRVEMSMVRKGDDWLVDDISSY